MGSRMLGVRGVARAPISVCALTLLLVAAAMLPAACSDSGAAEGAGTSSPDVRLQGGTYNFPLVELPTSVSPFTDPASGFQVAYQIFEGLVAYAARSDGTVAVVPCLAQSWSADEDATVWTFRLRRGVTFQQPLGREMTARDVVADYRYSTDATNRAWYAYTYAAIEGTDDAGHAADPARLGVEAPDRYTVRFTLKRPCADFPNTLGGPAAWVWPADYLRRVGKARFGRRPVGTGPFALLRLVRDEYIDLARNPGWWDAASGRPYLDTVHFVAFPNVSSELLAFRQGLIDYTWVPQGQVESSRGLPQVQSGEWASRTVPLLALGYVGFNMTDPVVGGDGGLPLRQAVNYACDREQMIAELTDGVFRPPTGLVPSVLPGWQASEFPQARDLVRAAALYEQAGSPRLRVIVPADRFGIGVARLLRSDCAEAGMDLRIKILPWGEYQKTFARDGGPAVYLFGWVADYPSADSFLYDMYHSSSSAATSGTAYAEPVVDRLLEQARATADVRQRLELNHRAAEAIIADMPVLPLFQYADYRLTNERIAGFYEDPLGYVDMWELWVR